MDDKVIAASLLLFLSMFVPLPSPAGLAITLWALAEGVPLPLVIGLYVAQDLLTFALIRRFAPRLSAGIAAWIDRLPSPAARLLRSVGAPAGCARAGLLSASLASFYAGAAWSSIAGLAPARSAAVVIGADVLKYANGLAVALGAAHVLPSSPFTLLAAPLAGLAAMPLMRLLPPRRPVVPVALSTDR